MNGNRHFCVGGNNISDPTYTLSFITVILNTNKIQEKICAEILYKPVKNSYEIIGLIFSKF